MNSEFKHRINFIICCGAANETSFFVFKNMGDLGVTVTKSVSFLQILTSVFMYFFYRHLFTTQFVGVHLNVIGLNIDSLKWIIRNKNSCLHERHEDSEFSMSQVFPLLFLHFIFHKIKLKLFTTFFNGIVIISNFIPSFLCL